MRQDSVNLTMLELVSSCLVKRTNNQSKWASRSISYPIKKIDDKSEVSTPRYHSLKSEARCLIHSATARSSAIHHRLNNSNDECRYFKLLLTLILLKGTFSIMYEIISNKYTKLLLQCSYQNLNKNYENPIKSQTMFGWTQRMLKVRWELSNNPHVCFYHFR